MDDPRLFALEQSTRKLGDDVEAVLRKSSGIGESISSFEHRLGKIETGYQSFGGSLASLQNEVSTNGAALNELRQRLDEPEFEAFSSSAPQLPVQAAEAKGDDATATLDRERVVLRTAWSAFQKNIRKLYGVEIRSWREQLQQDAVYQQYLKVVEELPGTAAVEGEGRLALNAANRRLRLLSRLYEIPESLKPREGQQKNVEQLIAQYRSLGQFLTLVESTDLGSDLLLFDPRHWLRGEFLKVANEVLKSAPNSGPARTVEDALRSVGLRAMEIVPGRTRLDNRRHDAKSQVSNLGLPGGVIADVVRWGFETLDAEPKVLSRAIVVVNRA